MSSSRVSVPFLIVGLLVGAVGGYFGAFIVYQPQLDNYQVQNAALSLSVSRLQSNLSQAETRTSALESQVESLESELVEAEGQISSYESEVSSYQVQVSSLGSEVSNLQSRLDNIMGITVTQHYEWVYGTWLWEERYQWDLPIPMSLYCEYYERPRPTSWSNWVSMAKDSSDDYYIDQMIQKINAAAIREGFTEKEKVNFVISFVQSLPYTEDDVTTPWNEYPRYPIETLFDRGGDCEDTSILVAALLDRLGYDVALLILLYEDHAAVGVSIEGVYGSYYEHEGEKYFYLETTGDDWTIGQIPYFEDDRAYIYPLNP